MRVSVIVFFFFCAIGEAANIWPAAYAQVPGPSQEDREKLMSTPAVAFDSIDTLPLPPFEPRGYNGRARTLSEKLRNLFLSAKFKRAAFQRDSIYRAYTRLEKEKTAQTHQYIAEKEQQQYAFDSLQGLYDFQADGLKQCIRDRQTCSQEYHRMKDSYDRFRDSSLSSAQKLKLAIQENDNQKRLALARSAELERLLHQRDSATKALKYSLQKALFSFDSSLMNVYVEDGRVHVSFSERLLFASGSADIRDPRASEALQSFAGVVNANQKLNVLVEGHTDSIPIHNHRFADNWDLSTARAVAVVRELSEKRHVDPRRLTAAGRSSFIPKDTNATAEGRANNRRIEVILIPVLDEFYRLLGSE